MADEVENVLLLTDEERAVEEGISEQRGVNSVAIIHHLLF